MRFLGGLALLTSVVLTGLSVAAPGVLRAIVDDPDRTVLAALAVAGLAVALSGAMVAVYVRARLVRYVRLAERLASGDLDARAGPSGWGLERRLAAALDSIATLVVASHDAASVDRLTGVASRQTLLATLFTEVERASRYDRPFSVGFVDIDHFKQVNDTYGHAAGDSVLRAVAQAVKANLRGTDVIGRYGGEEFMLLLTETTVEDAATLAEKLRTVVGRLRLQVDGNRALTVTISIGIAGGVGQSLRTDQLVRDADAAMYSAKSLGRNQTYIFAEPSDDARVPRAPISPAGRARAHEIGAIGRAAAERALAAVIAPMAAHRGRPSAIVASIVAAMAGQLGLPDAEVERIRIAALLHDIGKIAIPGDVLEKPTALTSAEWRTVVQHPRIGQLVLEQATSFRDAAPVILHHHERYSGHGYPFGLRGNDIPLGARILAIADAYDAMTQDRPYKRAVSHEHAIKEIRRHGGTQFDPELVKLFCDLFADTAPEPDPSVRALIETLPGAVDTPRPSPVEAPRPIAAPRRARRSGSRNVRDVSPDTTPNSAAS